MIEIDVLDRGFVVATDGKRTAYSDVTDLLLDLRLLLSSEPTVIGVNMAAPGSDIGVTAVVSKDSDGTTIVYHEIEDDGWRVWEGSSRPPPGLKDSDTVEVKFRDMPNWTGPVSQLLWEHKIHRCRSDIVAYRVVRS